MKAAGCILPVSATPDLPSNMGLRHRAAVGLTERTDAFTIIVSEQTGKISYSLKGVLFQNIEPAQLKQILEAEFRFMDKA
jgi:DNA integrity scanning protein DisA with diadenylate cyclase activity